MFSILYFGGLQNKSSFNNIENNHIGQVLIYLQKSNFQIYLKF